MVRFTIGQEMNPDEILYHNRSNNRNDYDYSNNVVVDDDDDEILFNDNSCDNNNDDSVMQWWKKGGGPIPIMKEDGELLEPNYDDQAGYHYRDGNPVITALQKRRFSSINSNYSYESNRNDSFRNDYHEFVSDQRQPDANQNNDELVQNDNTRMVLSSWRQKNNNIPNQIHHHPSQPLFYAGHYNNYDSNLTNKREKLFKRYIVVALVAIILHRYCPPPPSHLESKIYKQPQSNHIIHSSWGDYIFFSGEVVFKSAVEISRTFRYISCGIVKNIFQDGTDVLKYILESVWVSNESNTSTDPMIPRFFCNLQNQQKMKMHSTKNDDSYIPTTIDKTNEYLSKHVVGQKSAIRVISTALDAWQLNHNQSKLSKASALGDDLKTQKPFVIWITGSEGIGKTQLAHTISKYVFSRCTIENSASSTTKMSSSSSNDLIRTDDHVSRDGSSCILELYGHDFTSVDDKNEENLQIQYSVNEQFLTIILQHVKKCSSGSVIIIKHVEEMASGHQIMELVKFIQKTRHSTHHEILAQLSNRSRKSSKSIQSNFDDDQSHHENGYHHRSESSTADSSASYVQWENVLFIFTSNIGTNKINQALRKHESISSIPFTQLQNSVRNDIDEFFFGNLFKLGNFINVVAPLFPLRYKEMRDIMKLKLTNLSLQNEKEIWKRLDVLDHAISHFVGPHYVDYIEWKKQDGKNIKSYPYIFSKHGALNLDDGTFLQTLRAKIARNDFNRPEKVVQINYDTHSDELLISLCDDDDDDDDDEKGEWKKTKGEKISLRCNEVWRGQID